MTLPPPTTVPGAPSTPERPLTPATPGTAGTAGPTPPARPAAPRPLRVALLGNPNTGKSTLFNALTGMRQKVGNFAGVTVDRVEGFYRGPDGARVSVLDLPGSYSLSATSPDEEIALDVLLGHARNVPLPDIAVVVADALHLERNLFLVSQLMELGLPVVVALNQMDAAQAAGVRIDVPELIHELGVPVVPLVATRRDGLETLRRAIMQAPSMPKPERRFTVPAVATQALAPLEALLRDAGFTADVAGMEALRLLAVAAPERHLSHVAGLEGAIGRARRELTDAGVNPRGLEAELRYGWIGGVVKHTVTHDDTQRHRVGDRIDAVALHRVWGPLVFLAIMALVFQSIFTWAAPLMDGTEGLVGALGERIGALLPEGDLRSLIVDGVIAGVGSVVVFVPQIAILFLFIGILEDTGYMARAALVMDRYMRRVGLHGKSFIPMLSGYACAVPGIMATRTIAEPKDRLATIMVVPLMSCSARLPVYTLLIGTFIPATMVGGLFNLQGLTMLAMYLLGTVAALAVAAVFKRTLLRAPSRPMLIELPPYRLPDPRSLFMTVSQRSMTFLKRAGTVIFAMSIVLWALATYPKTEVPAGTTEMRAQEVQLANSALGHIGHAIEPAVRPLGFDWKIGVGIAASFAAREVFVSTMGTIYGVGASDEGSPALSERLRNERDATTGEPTYTPLVALTLMVFYVFALMCVSTVAITVRETGGGARGWGWAGFQFGYMLVLAYGASLIVYHGGRALGLAG
ncbi:MAG TPA: ferrous iron transport protein B [Gemmatimonadales bacterium]